MISFNFQGMVADDNTGYAGLTKEFVVHVKVGEKEKEGNVIHRLVQTVNEQLSKDKQLLPTRWS